MVMKRHKSDILASVHKAAADLSKAGCIDKTTMRAFDDGCVMQAELPMTPKVKAIRKPAS